VVDQEVDNQHQDAAAFKDIIGRSRSMQSVFGLARRVAATDSTVLIQGETGTGKGLLARAIHRCSARQARPFITINCGAIPENLLESELFGHVRGAFTGATAAKVGKFELASGGSLFLDEIGDMSPDLQVKLLRVLEEGEFEPVGGTRTQRSDVRVLAATHRDLEQAVADDRFREDLYYRICVIPISLPPLRERHEDVSLLVDHFITHFQQRMRDTPVKVTPAAMDRLRAYHWPGNVRELRNLAEWLIVLKGGSDIAVEDLPRKFRQGETADPLGVEMPEEGICLTTAVSDFEKALILQSLEKSNGIKNQAAKLLKLNRTTLVEKIKRHQI